MNAKRFRKFQCVERIDAHVKSTVQSDLHLTAMVYQRTHRFKIQIAVGFQTADYDALRPGFAKHIDFFGDDAKFLIRI